MPKTAPFYVERRREPRASVNAPARLLHGGKLSLWADCTIRDLSASGAKIELPEVHVAPPRFFLLHFEAGIVYEALLAFGAVSAPVFREGGPGHVELRHQRCPRA